MKNKMYDRRPIMVHGALDIYEVKEYVEVGTVGEVNTRRIPVFKNEKGKYFMWDGVKYYFKDFEELEEYENEK